MVKSISSSLMVLLLLMAAYYLSRPEIANQELAQAMLNNIWLPTAFMSLFTGALLASSGFLIQTSLDNDFASPSTLGIAAGALLGAVLTRVLLPEASLNLVWLGALIGGFVLSLAVLAVSQLIGGGKLPVVLIGMALGLSAGALSSLFMLYFENQTDGLFLWGSGQVLQTNTLVLEQTALPMLVCLLLSVVVLPKLALFLLGDTHAAALGLAIKPWRWTILLLAISQAALATSIVGMIGFVGLMAPHLTRLVLRLSKGANNIALQWFITIVIGAALVLAAEWCSRSLLFLGYRLPTGAFTALLGAPYFVFLLFQRSGKALAAVETQHLGLKPFIHASPALVIGALSGLLVVSLYFCLAKPQNIGAVWINQRVLLAGLGGFGLACAGTLLQTLFKNPMASPDISGVSAVAVLLIACVLVYFPAANQLQLTLAALVGGSAVMALLSWGLKQQLSVSQLALFGIVITAFAGTATQILLTFGSSTASVTMMWLAGTTYGATFERIIPIASITTLSLLTIVPLLRQLDLMPLGEILPKTLGVALQKQRLLLLAISALLTAICVSSIGSISFVGLLAPHCARLLGLYRHKHLIPASGITGAILLIWADSLGRELMAPNEIPAGLMVSVIGSIYFILLLLISYRKRT
ncbi:Fe3+-hydroxamate ABC transporter permease FhuB [Agarivorans sp. Toyoura001]|uniref:iron ABC transporter permease n=1 Tax=Agarivorans sp. Toyoura001 TaxID=2283141 RepID=UPI0010D66566|nr:iron ABC transporter permease [Agarivorans sp. Toyoura001]GDY25895.1 Fe3+-hydroxamate ABC transporter permease FhuB [Agarivorans sp. Toyoura001]